LTSSGATGSGAPDPAADRDQIQRVLYRYGEALDTRNWRLLDEVFVPDVVSDYGGGPWEGLEQLRRILDHFNSGSGPSLHMFANVMIDLDGDEARARCTLRAFHQGAGNRAGLTYEAFGRYDDELVRTPSGWRIRRRRYVMEFQNGSPEVLGPPG
jgi:3-phenylpropionate/cinnamic acid dioxygenase small subunit